MGQTLADAILSTAADAILLADPDNIIRFWNPGATRIFGFSPEEAVGQPLDIIIPENLRARHNEGYAQTMATGVTRYGSGDILAVPALTKDGRRISVEFTIVLLHGDDGKVSGIAAILRDVTERFQELRTLRRRIAELSAAGSKALSG
jgi:PAS domain S-box-containing protein